MKTHKTMTKTKIKFWITIGWALMKRERNKKMELEWEKLQAKVNSKVKADKERLMMRELTLLTMMCKKICARMKKPI